MYGKFCPKQLFLLCTKFLNLLALEQMPRRFFYFLKVCPRPDSNWDRLLRREAFYPLNYEDIMLGYELILKAFLIILRVFCTNHQIETCLS